MIIELLDLGMGRFVGYISRLRFRFVGKNPLDVRMGIIPGCLGQFHHVGLDPGGGDIEVLEIE